MDKVTAQRNKLRAESGSVGIFLLVTFIVIVVGVVIYLGLLNQGIIEAPEFIANIPGMDQLLPEPEEVADEPVNIPQEQSTTGRAQQFAETIALLKAENTDLEAQVADKDTQILVLQTEVDRLTTLLTQSRDSSIQQAAAVHEAMGAEESAQILQNLTPQESALILKGMREGSAADILEVMDEDYATRITEILAGFSGEIADILSEGGQ